MLKKSITLTLIAILIGFNISNSTFAQQNIAQKAYAIFEQSCLICHGENGAYRESLIIQHTSLIEGGTVIPGNPDTSVFYQRLIETNIAKRMPLGQPPLDAEAIETIRQWILAGAPDWSDTPRPTTDFITPDIMLQTIEKHLNTLSDRDKSFARYFTLTHLYNAGETAEALNAYRRALSKLVNSLSWGREIVKPQPIDAQQTVFYIDLRDYEWDIRNDAWTQIEQAYPYRMTFEALMQTHLREKMTTLQQEMSCEVPFVNVDWFLATASLPPLYHDILALPNTDRELEAALEVFVAENILNAPGKRVWRAGFNDSGVSRHNRVVERHISRYGAYWKSYDFSGSAESQNIFTHPLDFTHDGGEIIFNLPNGLQAYYLVDGNGNRLDVAPTNIVSNPAASDPAVRNGLSCIGCHTEGMKTFEDEVRAVVEQSDNPPFNKARALDLYVQKAVMDDLVEEDTQRFRTALQAAGGVFGGIEPVQRFHETFQAPLRPAQAAATVGLETEAFLEKINANVSLQNLVGALVLENGTIKRDAWTSAFHDVIAEINSPDSVLPPVDERPEIIPGTGVHIPDPNLRAAIAEALGKEDADTDPITLEEMETLITLRASNRGIQDLTGLQHAINLEEMWISGNPVSDISPLAKLTNFIGLHAWETLISDLAPLAGLKKLRWLDFGRTPSDRNRGLDLTPLSGITSLKKLTFYACGIKDITPLADLTGLTQLRVGGNREISDASPVAGLINLEHLDFHHDSISDLSPLAELTNLKSLNLYDNRLITDLSPLAGLTSLTELHLGNNMISDMSPLARLTNLIRLRLSQNMISDVSPLAGLINLEILHLHTNLIYDISDLAGLSVYPNHINWSNNPGAPIAGQEILGPWLWMLIPGERLNSTTDLLASASNGSVTEHQIAINGATEGIAVGDHKWTAHEISTEGKHGEITRNNMKEMLHTFGVSEEGETQDNVVYGCVILYAPQEQDTRMLVGSEGSRKVWLNGNLIHEILDEPAWSYGVKYDQFFPVTLKQGANVLLVAIDRGYWITGHFSFEEGAEYTVVPPGVGFTVSETSLLAGDTFTLQLNAEYITNLAGWQTDITFDPNILEAVEATEGGFLKTEDGNTFFQDGTIDNTKGKITDLFSARIAETGVSGTGTLLSVTFRAKAGGETQVTLENFEFSSMSGEIIPIVPPNITITVGEYPAYDVNQDGRVSVVDLVLVAKDLGADAPANFQTDVNRDGVINVQDLILVAQHIGETAEPAAPTIILIDSNKLTPAIVQAWIKQAQIENDGSLAFRHGIENLQKLLASLIPEKTALLANYPNPFNPETWIPYHLAAPSEVNIAIYAVDGTLIRTLALGHQPAGIYQSRNRAAHWDGKNEVDEPVASGIYFYTLSTESTRDSVTTENFTASRKMLIVK